MASAQLIMSWCLFYIVWKWSPHAYAVVNYIRSGSYACIFFCATMLTFLQFLPNVDRSDPEAVYAYQQNITIGLWAGMGPAFLWGAVASWMRLSYFTVHVLRKFKEAPPGTRAKFIYRFRDPREVEIVARCCRKWVDEDTLDKESVELAEKVLRAGMSLLPKEPYMVICE
ncbi:hypothetical protein QJQ45_000885 [Haematococcus lacustris]|nr:hypothetical protein QJQ45_000885 [Haematococcus lacustris]